MFLYLDSRMKALGRIIFLNGHNFLHDYRTGIGACIDKVNRNTGNLATVIKSLRP
jgi:hypothetical protein